jgi:outer membrane lipoprotein-sorting protein
MGGAVIGRVWVVGVLIGAQAAVADDRPTMSSAELRARHREALARVRTLSLDVSMVYTPAGSSPEMRGRYWRDGQRVRLHAEQDQRLTDTLVDTGQQRVLKRTAGSDEPPTGAITTPDARPSIADPDGLGLIVLPQGHRRLDKILDDARDVHGPTWVMRGGRELLRVQTDHYYTGAGGREYGPIEIELWLDPAANYLIAECEGRQDRIDFHGRITKFAEGGGGAFYPERVELSHFKADGSLRHRIDVTFSNVRINQPIATDVFRLTAPRGTKVHDAFRNTYYAVDESWQRAGQEVASRQTVDPAPPAPAEAPTVTAEEPARTPPWVWGLVGVSAAVLVLAVARRLRRSRD